MLEVRNLNAYYGAAQVLQDVSLQVGQGEIVALLGRNGTGKSTLLKGIMGLIVPQSGSIIFKGHACAGVAPYKIARAGIGWVPENRWIFPDLTVTENLRIGVQARRRPAGGQKAPWTVDRVFEHFPDLKARGRNLGAHLSGGEQQMLALGRALVGNPDLLLADEPMEGLAPLAVQAMTRVLEDIHKEGVAILLVEHDLSLAMSLAERVYLMGKARIGFEGRPQEVLADPVLRQRYLGEDPEAGVRSNRSPGLYQS